MEKGRKEKMKQFGDCEIVKIDVQLILKLQFGNLLLVVLCHYPSNTHGGKCFDDFNTERHF